MDTTKFKPLGDNVLLRIIKREEKTSGGIILSQAHSDPAFSVLKCVVESVGSGYFLPNGNRFEMPVKVGDVILLQKMGPVTIGSKRVVNDYRDSDWESLIVVSIKDILAVLETTEES